MNQQAEELKESKEVFVIKGKGYLNIVPKKKIYLTKFFDSADLGMNIEDWNDFERRFYCPSFGSFKYFEKGVVNG